MAVLFDDQATEEEVAELRMTPSDRRLVDLLRNIPFVFSFEYRALLFHALIQQRDASADPFLVCMVWHGIVEWNAIITHQS